MNFNFTLYTNEKNVLLNKSFFLLLKSFSTRERSWSDGSVAGQSVISTNDPVVKVCSGV